MAERLAKRYLTQIHPLQTALLNIPKQQKIWSDSEALARIYATGSNFLSNYVSLGSNQKDKQFYPIDLSFTLIYIWVSIGQVR